MPTSPILDTFRGDFPKATLNARRVAASVETPGCNRRAVLDAGVVNVEKLGELVSDQPRDRESPFAIMRGNQFEKKVNDNGMAEILSLVRHHYGLEIPEARQLDLSRAAIAEQYKGLTPSQLRDQRERLTRQAVQQMLVDPNYAFNLIRHSVTTLQFAGEIAHLEQDALAFAIRGRIHVVEIKSFARIDGRADPKKANATVRQSAVYVMSLQDLVESLGADPRIVDTRVMIVLPENLSFAATADIFDTKMHVRRLRRQLAEVPNAAQILRDFNCSISLPSAPKKGQPEEATTAARSQAKLALSQMPARFGDACVSCSLFGFCREEADRIRSIARLGSAVAGACGTVTDIDNAIALAAGARKPASNAERAVAESLGRGASVFNMLRGDAR